LSAYIVSIGRHTPRDAAQDAAELWRLANSLNRLNKIACNFELPDLLKVDPLWSVLFRLFPVFIGIPLVLRTRLALWPEHANLALCGDNKAARLLFDALSLEYF
jgi:hypothetical protein